MIRLVRLLYKLSKQPAYFATLKNSIPEIAHIAPTNDSVLMGYDFHLDESGPKLIEVNNNAGGLWLAWLAQHPGAATFSGKLNQKLLRMFCTEFALWQGLSPSVLKPRAIAIIDEQPGTQFLYEEMQAFATLLQAHDIPVFIIDPSQLTEVEEGLVYDGFTIDLIYNRHCDFYLHSPALAAVRRAWLQRTLCLSPNPHTYALLADKRRMIDWSTPAMLAKFPLTENERLLLQHTIPETRLLSSESSDDIWKTRKRWVFKPDNAYASRGVYLGKKITTSKFAEIDTNTTLIQQYISPSQFLADDGQPFKVDYRLFAYQQQILCVTARLYQGQVTNLRTEHGGFATVELH